MTNSRHLCACGKPATTVCDVTHADGHKSRQLMCGPWCLAAAEVGSDVDVRVEPEAFEGAMLARSCWCSMRAAGWVVPFCPEHWEDPAMSFTTKKGADILLAMGHTPEPLIVNGYRIELRAGKHVAIDTQTGKVEEPGGTIQDVVKWCMRQPPRKGA